MDCKTARSLLDFARSQSAELHPDEAEALDRHLNGCPECDALYRQERHIDAHIGRAVCAVPVPPGLRQLILDKLSVERRAKLRRMVVRGGGMAAAAAVLVMAASWVTGWLGASRSDVDLILYHHAIVTEGTTPERVSEWYQEQFGVSVKAPEKFDDRVLDYSLLRSTDLAVPPGIARAKPAPLLQFDACRKQGGLLRIFILSGRDFDLKSLGNNPSYSSQGVRVEVRLAPDADVAYLLSYPDDQGLEPFLIKAGPPG